MTGGGETQGLYTITGEDGMAYTITFPAAPIDITGPGGATMSVDNWSHDADGTAAIAGEQFNLGARLSIGAGQATGAYTGTYTITVEYN